MATSVRLDISFDTNLFAGIQSFLGLADELEPGLDMMKVKTTVITHNGSAGGWPTVKFTGDLDQIRHLVSVYWGDELTARDAHPSLYR